MTPEAEVGLTLLRVLLGLMIAAHGAQKVFGWFGGGGFGGVVKLVDSLGMRPPRFWAVCLCINELGAALLLAFGMFTPLAVGALGASFAIVLKKHYPNGFFNIKQGFEFPLLILVGLATILLSGAGPYSLDAVLGIQPFLEAPLVRLAALGMAIVGPMLALTSRARTRPRLAEPSH